MICPSCKVQSAPGLRFCGNCGATLPAILANQPKEPNLGQPKESKRKAGFAILLFLFAIIFYCARVPSDLTTSNTGSSSRKSSSQRDQQLSVVEYRWKSSEYGSSRAGNPVANDSGHTIPATRPRGRRYLPTSARRCVAACRLVTMPCPCLIDRADFRPKHRPRFEQLF